VMEIGEEALGSPEQLTPTATALGGDGWVADRAHGVTPQPMEGLPLATGAHGGGGSLPERSLQRCAMDSALEALF
jgi:hypothetical protein